MKKVAMVLGALGVALSMNVAQASQDVAKANGCLNCHDVSKKKMGPALKPVGAEWKKSNMATDKAVAAIKAKHADLKAKDDDLKAIVTWMQGL